MLAVVTDLGIMEPDETGELVLTALHPGATAEQVRREYRVGAESGRQPAYHATPRP